MSSTLLYPSVIDDSTLRQKATQATYLPIGMEGGADSAGTAVVGTLYSIARVDEANTLFGPASASALLLKEILDRGAGPVVAIASKKTTVPTLADRQSAWEKLESDQNIRLRLTDSAVEADLVALATSMKNADIIDNKQVAIVGLPSGTAKAALLTAADSLATDAIGATRVVLVAPGVYDSAGTLRGGNFAAAAVAAEVAKNSDPSNDLDLWTLPLLTAIEKGTDGLPVFRRKVAAGAEVNDFEDLLQGGVSALQPSQDVAGGVQITHLRTVFQTNTSYDNLYTRIIEDQLFIDVKEYILTGNFLRAGNTEATRNRIKSGVEAVLSERRAWLDPVVQGDGTRGYNVSVTASANMRQVIVGYEGTIVRGISTVRVAANLSIPV